MSINTLNGSFNWRFKKIDQNQQIFKYYSTNLYKVHFVQRLSVEATIQPRLVRYLFFRVEGVVELGR